MSVVIDIDGSSKRVKNLGWLLRHNALVQNFYVTESHDRNHDCYLSANLVDGRRYTTFFNSREVLAKFLNRPSFKGLQVNWFDQIKLIGG